VKALTVAPPPTVEQALDVRGLMNPGKIFLNQGIHLARRRGRVHSVRWRNGAWHGQTLTEHGCRQHAPLLDVAPTPI
jgi:hypothetical protein